VISPNAAIKKKGKMAFVVAIVNLAYVIGLDSLMIGNP
jgi:hypothetical protein